MLRLVEPRHAYRLLNHGPTVLVGSAHAGRVNVMAAAWAMPLDFDTPKVAVVIDKNTLTAEWVQASGVLSLNVPPVAMAEAVLALGTLSGKTHADKLQRCGVTVRLDDSTGLPLVDGCIGHMVCRVLPATAHVAGPHDLCLAEVTQAWGDERVFRDGRWHFDEADASLRSLHYVAGGQFYAIGELITAHPPAA